MPNFMLSREDVYGSEAPWRRIPYQPGGPSNPPPRTVVPAPPKSTPLPPVAAPRPAPPMSRPLPPVAAPVAPPMSKPLPPMSTSNVRYMTTGGNTPPVQSPISLSLPQPNLPAINGNQFVATGGSGVPTVSRPSLANINGSQYVATGPNGVSNQSAIDIIKKMQAAFGVGPQRDPNAIVQDAVSGILNRGNPYIDRARTRALDFAGQRGMLNSSMAAGAAEGAAIDASMPLIQESLGMTNRREAEAFIGSQNAIGHGMNLTGQREQNTFTGQQNSLDRTQRVNDQMLQHQIAKQRDEMASYYDRLGQRDAFGFQAQQNALDRTQGVNNALLAGQLSERQGALQNYYSQQQQQLDAQIRQRLQADATSQQDWLADRKFSREFNGALSMMPINNAYDMASAVQKYALENPEVYTPTVISGMTNFFQQNMMSIMAQYFPNLINTGG